MPFETNSSSGRRATFHRLDLTGRASNCCPLPVYPVELDPRWSSLPRLPSRWRLIRGDATAGVEPLPHQTSLVRKAVETWPRGYFLADEVGLGRPSRRFHHRELLLSGKAERFLLLVPAAVLRQCRGAKREAQPAGKSVRGWEFIDPDNKVVSSSGTHGPRSRSCSPRHIWHGGVTDPRSSCCGSWDVVLVDEAHHARRSGARRRHTQPASETAPSTEDNNAYRLFSSPRPRRCKCTLMRHGFG